MTYCTKCGKPTDNGIMCKDCMILDSPWLSAMNRKENDLIEQIEQLKAENAALRERLGKAITPEFKIYEDVYFIDYVDEKGYSDYTTGKLNFYTGYSQKICHKKY